MGRYTNSLHELNFEKHIYLEESEHVYVKYMNWGGNYRPNRQNIRKTD